MKQMLINGKTELNVLAFQKLGYWQGYNAGGIQ